MTRYTENESNRDWIDELCATSTPEEGRGAFRFTIGNYLRQYSKKDDYLQEALKIQDYANRLVEYERSLLKPIIHELYSGGWTPEAIKQAMFPPELYTEAAEARMDVVDQNGNTAEHYPADEWIKNTGEKPDLPDGAVVEVTYRDGDTETGPVQGWRWSLNDTSGDITHYRIHQPEESSTGHLHQPLPLAVYPEGIEV